MNRKRKLIRNCIIIGIIILANYFVNGYYLSKEKCLEQLKNTLYLKDNIVLEEIQDDETILFVLMDEKNDAFSFIRMEECMNFLYQQSMIGFNGKTNEVYGELRMKIQKDYSFDYYSTFVDHDSQFDVNLIHRNNLDVYEIELPLNNNKSIRLNNWNNDYIIFVNNPDCYVDETKTIKAYDENNQLIEEVEYEKFFDHFCDELIYY